MPHKSVNVLTAGQSHTPFVCKAIIKGVGDFPDAIFQVPLRCSVDS